METYKCLIISVLWSGTEAYWENSLILLTNFLIKNVDTRARKVKVKLKYLSSNIFSKGKEKESIQNYKKKNQKRNTIWFKTKSNVVKLYSMGLLLNNYLETQQWR